MRVALGDVIRIDDATVLVCGQELDVAVEQPDVANVLLHRVGDTLFMVDSGVTEVFADAVRDAAGSVGPWRHIVLLTTHGHPDHVGNNDLVDQLGSLHGATVEHYVPAKDLPQMRNPRDYWTTSFRRLEGLHPLPAPPELVAAKVVSMFSPLHPFSQRMRTYEELPAEIINIGTVRIPGWSFADGAVQVLRTEGHCAGHVVVLFRELELLHMSDEVNGPCGVMHDADQLRLVSCLIDAAAMITEGYVSRMTDGHTFAVQGRGEALGRLETLIGHAVQLQQETVQATASQPVRPAAFLTHITRRAAEIGVVGANPSPVFTSMMAVNLLRQAGYIRRSRGRIWSTAELSPPPPSQIGPLMRTVKAGAQLAVWRLRKHR